MSTRGVNVDEIPVVSMLVATPILNLALFLDYKPPPDCARQTQRRGVFRLRADVIPAL
jgi:hypothetical protein